MLLADVDVAIAISCVPAQCACEPSLVFRFYLIESFGRCTLPHSILSNTERFIHRRDNAHCAFSNNNKNPKAFTVLSAYSVFTLIIRKAIIINIEFCVSEEVSGARHSSIDAAATEQKSKCTNADVKRQYSIFGGREKCAEKFVHRNASRSFFFLLKKEHVSTSDR